MRLRIAMMLLCTLLSGAALTADKPLDVRDAMTASQFHVTGLDKLTPQELAAFNAWLATYTHAASAAPANAALAAAPAAAPVIAIPVPTAPAVTAPTRAPAAVSSGNFGAEMLSPEVRGEPERIESRILGTFTGWNGRSVFKLENGQVWQQSDGSTYDVTLHDPKVVIKHLGMGYLLTLPGQSGTVFVRRIH